MAKPFSFTTSEMNVVERLLSPERFPTYLYHAAGNRKMALHFYLRNLRLSSSLFEVIGGFEVTLRNSIHITLSDSLQSEKWYDNPPIPWLSHERTALQIAKKHIQSRQKQITSGRVIAELTLGFWCGLTGSPYRDAIWIPHMHRAFPHKRLGRKAAFERLNAIRELRNRIAHHEFILNFDLPVLYANILETLGWICPVMRSWIETYSSFSAIWRSPSC
jgi:hypothetical protein